MKRTEVVNAPPEEMTDTDPTRAHPLLTFYGIIIVIVVVFGGLFAVAIHVANL